MPRVVIDNQAVEVPEGSTILDAARKLGVDIPALCFLDGYRPRTSCMVCQVRLPDDDRMVPSCATVPWSPGPSRPPCSGPTSLFSS